MRNMKDFQYYKFLSALIHCICSTTVECMMLPNRKRKLQTKPTMVDIKKY